MVKSKQIEEMAVEERYQKMEPLEHILALPDTYVGSIVEDDAKMDVYDEKVDRIMRKDIKYIPGLYKIFDEILVNAKDHSSRDKTCKNIDVTINRETGEITCKNDGEQGIPVVIHKEHNVYVPELLFGHLLTSENYKKTGKTWGGKNGYGAKLANVFSVRFIVDVQDAKNKLHYQQHFFENLSQKAEPVIKKLDGKGLKSYIKITFLPDYEKFGVTGLTEDMYSLFLKRVYDISACSPNHVQVTLNGKKIEHKTFNEYISKYYDSDEENKKSIIYEAPTNSMDRWEVGVVFDPDSGFRQVSFVNGISTFQGGSHVNHVVEQVVKGIIANIPETKKKGLTIKPEQIKSNLTFFINSVIEDPSFSSQTKELLTSKVTDFGSRCSLSQDFMKSISKTGVIEEVLNYAQFKAMDSLKKTDGKKSTKFKHPKLDSAEWAGTRGKSKYTRLIITEGDSAKTFATSGIQSIPDGTKRYGVFPIRGKLLNVREATAKQLQDNEEIIAIKQIIGLKHGKVYKDNSSLNYGGIIILTDQDYDGSHIKGLIINFIMFFWPSLIKNVDGFIQTIATPIVKVWKGDAIKRKDLKIFYTQTEYEEWKKEHPTGWQSKYYKGLGTSTVKEAKETFKEIDNQIIKYVWEYDKDDNNEDIGDNDISDDDMSDNDDDLQSIDTNVTDGNESELEEDITDKSSSAYQSILLGFSKSKISDRKTWLMNFDRNIILDNSKRLVSIQDFINRELIHFSNEDTSRSIPSICDGFKPSQRKILYSAFKKRLFKNALKVAQFGGYVSETTVYHHGEASLFGAIILMAQNFTGSNNINFLYPDGQFGNRRLGGKNAASPRYIYTRIEEITSYIFRKEDEPVYTQVDEDGILVEYENFAPIIPTVLVNGAEGIGTGFSTSIPCYNPLDIVKCVKQVLDGKEPDELTPWYKGFTGSITKEIRKEKGKSIKCFKTHGKYKVLNNNELEITELPIDVWSDNYTEKVLEPLLIDDPKKQHDVDTLIKDKKVLVNYMKKLSDNTVYYKLEFYPGVLHKLLHNNSIEEKLKLTSTINITNIHLYNEHGTITKYSSAEDVLKSYVPYRLELYEKRRTITLEILKNMMELISWKVKFVRYVLSGKIVVFEKNKPRKKEDVIKQLVDHGFPELHTDCNAADDKKSYNYVTNTLLFALTEEKIKELEDEMKEHETEYERYKNTTKEELWKSELDEFVVAYNTWLPESIGYYETEDNGKKKKTNTKKPIKVNTNNKSKTSGNKK